MFCPLMDILKRVKEEKNQVLTCLATHLAADTSMPVCPVRRAGFAWHAKDGVALKMNEIIFGEDNC